MPWFRPSGCRKIPALVESPHSNDVLSQMPEVTLFGEAWLLQLGFHIEVIFLDLFAVDLVEQRLDLRRVKACLTEVEVGILASP